MLELMALTVVLALAVLPLLQLTRTQVVHGAVMEQEVRAQCAALSRVTELVSLGFDALAARSAGPGEDWGPVAGEPTLETRCRVERDADDGALLLVEVGVREVQQAARTRRPRTWTFVRAISDPEASVRGRQRTRP